MSFFGSISFFLLLILVFIPAIVLGFTGRSLQGYRTAVSILIIGVVFWPDKIHLAHAPTVLGDSPVRYDDR